MNYRNEWMDDANAREVQTVTGFGTVWLIDFNESEEDSETFDLGAEEDETEAKEERISRSMRSAFPIVRGDGSEIWTSTESMAMELLGATNTLFASA